MRSPVTSRGRDKHVVAVLVVPDSVLLEVVVAQDIFGLCTPLLAGITGDSENSYTVVLCGEARRHVLANGVDLGELAPLETLLSADTVIVPGVREPLGHRSEKLLDTLRQAEAAGARMVSFCGGAFILGYAGILDRRRATTHWLLAGDFQSAFPRVRLDIDRLYIDDDPVHTAGGMFAATDLSLHLVAIDLGQTYANDLGRVLVSAPHRPGGQAQFVKSAVGADAGQPMDGFLQWVRDHVTEPLTLAELATQHSVSERTLIRKFREATGMSAFDWIARERICHAKVLLESTNYRVGDIAAMIGFRSSETFRRNFEKIVGVSAGVYRTSFHNDAASAGNDA
jgi:AraC family transcriptional activator FtrA